MSDKRFNHGNYGKLITEERRRTWQPRQFLSRFALPSGAHVLDLGCGPGFWTLPLAEIVGKDGSVYAVDVSQEMLDVLAEQGPPSHVIPKLGPATAIPLSDTEVDFAWVAFVLHEVEPPKACLREIQRVLRPGGRVSVLDWHPDADGSSGPPLSHRISPSEVRSWLLDTGFCRIEQTWQNDHTYLIEAQR